VREITKFAGDRKWNSLSYDDLSAMANKAGRLVCGWFWQCTVVAVVRSQLRLYKNANYRKLIASPPIDCWQKHFKFTDVKTIGRRLDKHYCHL